MTTPSLAWTATEWAPFLESRANGSVGELSDLVLQYGDFLAPHTIPLAGQYNVTLLHPKGSLQLAVGYDYVGLGQDWRTYLRLPLRPDAAQRIADALDCVLPTTSLVDRLLSVGKRLKFHTGNPGRLSTVWRTNGDTNQDIAALRLLSGDPKLFVAHSKDVVLTNKLNAEPDQVAIYGAHGTDRKVDDPVQDLQTKHVWHYCDYSQRARLTHKTCLLAGVETPTLDAISTFNNPIPLTFHAYKIRTTTGRFNRAGVP